MLDDHTATQLAADTAIEESAQTAFNDLVDPNIHNLQDYLNYLGICVVPLIPPNMILDYAAWPPIGIYHQRTYSWLYMALILQSANGGQSLLPILVLMIIPEAIQPTWSRWIQTIQ